MTLDSWRPGRDGDGWKVKERNGRIESLEEIDLVMNDGVGSGNKHLGDILDNIEALHAYMAQTNLK